MLRFRLGERVVDYDNSTLLNTEAIQLQKLTGRTIADLQQGLRTGDAEARSALFWLACRRQGDTTRYGDLQFDYTKLAIEVVPDDTAVDVTAEAGEAADPSRPGDAPPPPSNAR